MIIYGVILELQGLIMVALLVIGSWLATASAPKEVVCNIVADYGIAIGPTDQTAGKARN